MDNPGQNVTMPMLLAGLVILLNGDTLSKLRAKAVAGPGGSAPALPTDLKPAFMGWGIAYATLLILAESAPGTFGELAVAFAWLIAISVIFAVGPTFWSGLSGKIGKGSLFG
jgi:hypothetical protein